MRSITPRALKLALSIKKSIKDHYLVEASLVKLLYEDRDKGEDVPLEEYYYITYKDYDKLRLIIVNILHLIIHDIKNIKENIRKELLI